MRKKDVFISPIRLFSSSTTPGRRAGTDGAWAWAGGNCGRTGGRHLFVPPMVSERERKEERGRGREARGEEKRKGEEREIKGEKRRGN